MTETFNIFEPPQSDSHYGFVTGRIIRRISDTTLDTDTLLDAANIVGSVVFTPVEKVTKTEDYRAILFREPVVAPLDSMGFLTNAAAKQRGIWLTVGYWEVSFRLTNHTLTPFYIEVLDTYDEGNPLDLADAQPEVLPSSTPRNVISLPSGGGDGDILVKNADGTMSWASYILRGVTLEDLRGPMGPDGPAGPPGPTGPLATSADADNAIGQLFSKGTDLIVNGNGSLRSNTNFSALAYDSSDIPPAAVGAFKTPAPTTSGSYPFVDQYFNIRPGGSYKLSFHGRQLAWNTTALLIGTLQPYDADKNMIAIQNYGFVSGTTTTLARDLVPGDTKVYLTSVANWGGQAGKPLQTIYSGCLIIWDYVSSGGYAWPAETYSRNVYTSVFADGAVNPSDNAITLKSPWTAAQGTHRAGTSLSQGYGVGGAIEIVRVVPKNSDGWVLATGTYSPGPGYFKQPASTIGSGAGPTTPMPPGTSQFRIMLGMNVLSGGIPSQHAIANVSLSDAAAAQAMVGNPANNSVGTATIKDNAITLAKMADASVGTDELIDNSVTLEKLLDGSVDTDKLVDKSVTTIKIADRAIGTPQIAAKAITKELLADDISLGGSNGFPFNVKDYGAKGDGVTDDTQAIKDCVTASGRGGSVYFPVGNYVITDQIRMIPNQLWFGLSAGNDNPNSVGTIITCRFKGSNIWAQMGSIVGINFMGPLVKDPATCVGYTCIETTGSMMLRDVCINGFENGILAKSTWYMNTEHVFIRRCLTGVNLDYCYNVTMFNLRYHGTFENDVRGYGVRMDRASMATFHGGSIEQYTNGFTLVGNQQSLYLNGTYMETSIPTGNGIALNGGTALLNLQGCQIYLNHQPRWVHAANTGGVGSTIVSIGNKFKANYDATVLTYAYSIPTYQNIGSFIGIGDDWTSVPPYKNYQYINRVPGGNSLLLPPAGSMPA